ncbi:MAG: nucleoside phosphorylase [Chloroflexota bacterium]|nr:nucleoside phosphorylase [Chloroflexota bacterium]
MPSSPPDWLNPHGDATPVIDPESHVREYAERRGRDPNENCPPLVIGGFINLMVEPLAEAVGAAESDVRLGLQGPKTISRAAEEAGMVRPGLRIGELDGHPIGVARIPVGSARSVMTLEELMALGARTFLIAGATGALKPGIQVGDYVIATSGLREEGASYHYRPPEHPARANGPAARALIDAAQTSEHACHAGRVWSTDAPYREFTGKVHRYGQDGVLSVDMEASALMIVTEFRGADLGMILTVSDLVYRRDWPNIFGTDEYRANCMDMADVIVRAARDLLAGTG